MTPTQRDRLFTLIDQACTNRQIRSLLRAKRQDDRKVRVSGKAEVLMRHLRDAHERGVVRIEDLTKLLARGEENGRQHLFLYRTTHQAKSSYSDMGQVRDRVLAELEDNPKQLPRFVLQPDGRTLSDVRLDEGSGGTRTMTAKWYSGRRVERVTKDEPYVEHGISYIRRIIRIEDVRHVSMVRLHSRGMLEIRIAAGVRESRATCLEELEEIWALIGAAIPRVHFVPMDLRGVMQAVLAESRKRNAKVRVSAAQATDGEARAEFNPAQDGGSLFDAHKHREALRQYEDFAKLDVFWHSPESAENEIEEIRCQMCLYEVNGIRLGSKHSIREVDFVLNRLWELH